PPLILHKRSGKVKYFAADERPSQDSVPDAERMINVSMAEKRFQHWYTHSELPPDLREELKSIQHSPREIEERFHSQLSFGTGGLRGQLGAGTNRLNIYTIRKASLGLAHYLLNQNGSVLNVTVVIA